ncbi:MAG: hypothetical protein JXR73_18625 [Candidatus Omnitrophica bacterium]|nr:hypothetical protein [Candidatus Omnitrophota bacterium]
MAGIDSNLYKRLREDSQDQARTVLMHMDQRRPSWVEDCIAPRRKPWFSFGKINGLELMTQTACLAVIVCLWISASSVRLTADAVSLAIKTDLQSEQVVSREE